ncbi:MAG: glycosyltransferase, partial [Bacteroidota bacterium]
MSKANETMRFSVIIPTYNRVTKLRQCVESLLAQDVDPEQYEIIVVNDGSADGTTDYVRSLRGDRRVRLIEIPNSGPARARNRGTQLAEGSILAFTDDDCTCPPAWLRDLERAMQATNAVAVGGVVQNRIMENDLTRVYEETNRYLAQKINEEEGKARFLTTNNFAVLRSMLRQ